MMQLMPQNITKVNSHFSHIIILIRFILDPDLVESRLLAQEKRTLQLQNKYNQDAVRYKEKQEEVC